MSMNDTVSDMLTRIRNACLRKHKKVSIPYSVMKENIVVVFQKEGFIKCYDKSSEHMMVSLKYDIKQQPLFRKIRRISKPGLRVYKSYKEIKPVMNGQGIFVVSTSQGVISDNECRIRKIGGEVICLCY